MCFSIQFIFTASRIGAYFIATKINLQSSTYICDLLPIMCNLVLELVKVEYATCSYFFLYKFLLEKQHTYFKLFFPASIPECMFHVREKG